ncbi:MAG: AAA family ATPase [Desulfuromonadales bacterium]
MLQPSMVFRPGKLPIAPSNVYVARGKAEETLKKSLQRGFIPLIYGEYGVGKTSMARHIVTELYGDENLINIESVSGKSLNDIFARCLERFSLFSWQKTEALKEEKNPSPGLFGFLFKKSSRKSSSEPARPDPSLFEQNSISSANFVTDSRIIEICEHYGAVLLLDEIHKASEELLDEIVRFIKSYGNANCEKFKIIILGTSSEATKLIHKDPGIDRLIEDIPLPPMCHKEVNYVVEQGMRNLAIGIVNEAKERILSISGGYPNILQYLCLESSEYAFGRKSRKLDVCDVENALTDYVENFAGDGGT